MAEDPESADEPTLESLQESVAKLEKAIKAEREETTTWKRKAGEYSEQAQSAGDLRRELEETRRKLDASSHGIDDEKLQELVQKHAGTQLSKASETIDALKGEVDGYRSKYESLMIQSKAREVLRKSGVRDEAIEDAEDKVRRFYEAKDGQLVMRDLEALTVGDDVKKLLLTAKGEPVDIEGFAHGYLRQKHPIYFPAEGGSGAGDTGNGHIKPGGKQLTQQQAASLSPEQYAEWRSEGGRVSN